MTRTLAPIAALVAAALAVAGCGGGSSYNSTTGSGAYGGGGTTATQPASAPTATGAVVSVATVPKLGKIIVDSRGFTLYDFHKDKGTTSSCYGGCPQVWPPLLTKGAPQPGNGAPAAKLGTTERKDGTTQVTFAGHPLYTYVEDTKPGEVNGNDFSSFGAQWYALEPSGEEAGD
jgi:predicted lipoprotein with Yx(FWY)xxD motif